MVKIKNIFEQNQGRESKLIDFCSTAANKLLVDIVDMFIIVLDKDLKVRKYNKAFGDMITPQGKIKSLNIYELLADDIELKLPQKGELKEQKLQFKDKTGTGYSCKCYLIRENDYYLLSGKQKRNEREFSHKITELNNELVNKSRELTRKNIELEKKKAKIEELLRNDNLTGLANRRAFGEFFEKMFSLARRNSSPLSLIMLDLDNFKKINDTYGHQIGDEVLKSIGELLEKNTRQGDMAARIGGDEFYVLQPNTSHKEALAYVERLEVAIKYDANKVFEDYALWLIKFLSNRMLDLPEERVREQMIIHYRIIGEVLEEEKVSRDYQQKAQLYLENAINVTEEADLEEETVKKATSLSSGENILDGLSVRFLNSLLQTDREEAQKVIEEALDNDISLEDIYLEIFQKTMIRVGELWHSGDIMVDEEHYITSMVQNIMMQLWPKIFAGKKIDRRILVCTAGNELHEMGGRILCDLMEIKGWNSVYLGAAVPAVNIISAIKKHEPNLVGLSVTMPFYLEQCERAVKKIKANDSINNIKIAVGGRAFSLAPHLPAEWGVDVTVNNGIELAEWGKKYI